MPRSNILLVLFAISSAALKSQVPAASQSAAIPPPKADATVVAGIPVNYEESKAGTYTLADSLMSSDGKKVASAKVWGEDTHLHKRPQLLHA